MEARKSQIATTIEQSKRLLAAGIDQKSADMSWHKYKTSKWDLWVGWSDRELPDFQIVPAWSLSRLIDLIANTGIPMNYGKMTDSTAVLEHAVNALEYQLRHANH